jgi:hypothetical protein
LLDLTVNNYPLWSIESLKKAVLTDSAQAYGGGAVFKSHEEQAERREPSPARRTARAWRRRWVGQRR